MGSSSEEAELPRSAVASLRGYRYQMTWSALHWAKLDRHTALTIEGFEDIDSLSIESDGVRVRTHEQIKDRAVVTTSEVVETIVHFAAECVQAIECGDRFKGVFRSTGGAPSPRHADLRAFVEGGRFSRKRFAQELLRRLSKKDSTSIRWLIRRNVFAEFLASIEWIWSAPNLSEVGTLLDRELQRFVDHGCSAAAMNAHLVDTVFDIASTRPPSQRSLTRYDLDVAVNDFAFTNTPAFDDDDSAVALAIASNSNRSIACALRVRSLARLARQLAHSSAMARAQGYEQEAVHDNDIRESDIVVYASVAPRGRRSARVAVRDVLRHAQHRWDLTRVLVDNSESESRLPSLKGVAYEPTDHSVDLVRVAREVARATLTRIDGTSQDGTTILRKLRWIHFIAEREYWTEQSHPSFCRGFPG